MKSNDNPIIVEQIFDTSMTKVWDAITELEQMKQWFFENIPSFKPELGFETQFVVNSEARKFTHLWKITEVSPIQKITYNWKYEEYQGDSEVTFELSEKDNQTLLRLTHKVIKSFPDDVPEFERKSGIQGWNYFIRMNLKEFLKKNKKNESYRL